MADEKDAQQPPRTTAQIENDLAAIRSRLAANVAGLIDEIHPQRIKERQIEGAKQFAADEAENLRSQFVTPDGALRLGRIAAVGAAVAGLVGFLVIVKALGGRRAARAGR